MRNRKQCEEGDDILRRQLVSAGTECLHQECCCENMGNVCCYCVEDNAVEMKRVTVEIENNLSVGRLPGMGIFDKSSTHIERTEIGESPRTCLLYGSPAEECARGRTHPVAEFGQITRGLLLKELQEQNSRRITELACRSLLYEVYTDGNGNSPGTSKKNLSQTALGKKNCRLRCESDYKRCKYM